MTKRLIILLMLTTVLSACDLLMPTAIPTQIVIDTATIPAQGPTVTPPVIESTPTLDVQPTEVNPPVNTQEPTATLPSPGPRPTARPVVWYEVQPGTPILMQSFIHADQECHWTGVGGQVFDMNGAPVLNLLIQLGGIYNGQDMSSITMTGLASELGPSGFEFMLAGRPIASEGVFWLRIFDQNGAPISDRVPFNTSEACDQNFVMINFVHSTAPPLEAFYWIFLPLIDR